jgi:hypothetical protein
MLIEYWIFHNFVNLSRFRNFHGHLHKYFPRKFDKHLDCPQGGRKIDSINKLMDLNVKKSKNKWIYVINKVIPSVNFSKLISELLQTWPFQVQIKRVKVYLWRLNKRSISKKLVTVIVFLLVRWVECLKNCRNPVKFFRVWRIVDSKSLSRISKLAMRIAPVYRPNFQQLLEISKQNEMHGNPGGTRNHVHM